MKIRLPLASLLAVLILPLLAFADTETVDGIEWTYTVLDGEVSVGSGSYSGYRAVPTTTSGAITIPAILGGYPVSSIGAYAFYGCSGLTSVTIPDSITSIEDEAFRAAAAFETLLRLADSRSRPSSLMHADPSRTSLWPVGRRALGTLRSTTATASRL